MAASRMNCIPLLFLSLLAFCWQGTDSRCIDMSFEQGLQPLPPGVQRCSLPEGLLRPDILPPPGQKGSSAERGDSRIVSSSHDAFENYGGGPSTTSPQVQLGKPVRPMGPVFGGRPRDPIPGPVRIGTPQGPGPAGQDDGRPHGFKIRYDTPLGHPRPLWKAPGIPYIPTAKEKGGPSTHISRPPLYRPRPPYVVPYGGGARPYNSGQQSSSSPYGAGSIASGPRGREDGSYGPIPIPGTFQGGQQGIGVLGCVMSHDAAAISLPPLLRRLVA